MSRQTFLGLLATLSIASIGLRAAIPPVLLFGAGHDDELMVLLAGQILDGNWLGDYGLLGHRTLSKPAGYPMFLAIASFLPWDPTVTAHAVLLLGALLLTRELRNVGVSRGAAVSLYGFAVSYPLWFGDPISRIYRESILVPLALLVVALAFRTARLLITHAAHEGTSSRPRRSRILLSAVGLGAALSATIAVKPGWVPMAIVGLGLPTLVGLTVPGSRRRLPALALSLIAATSVMAVAPLAIATANNQTYGVFLQDTYASGSFPRALSAMAAIRTPHRRYVIVPSEARAAAYSISPTARRLEPFLENSDGGWRSVSCTQTGICDESTAWFPWELRDAVELAGLGSSAVDFEKTLSSISDDISSACEAGEIACGAAGLAPGLPAIDRIPRRELIDSIALGINIMRELQVGAIERGNLNASPEQVALWARFVDLEEGKGPYSEQAQASLRPSARNLGSVVRALRDIYESLFWIGLIGGVLGGIVRAPGGYKSEPALALLHVGFWTTAAGLGAFLGQLALLEAGAGLYLSMGASLYLLPAHALLVAALLFGWSRLILVTQRRLSPPVRA